MARGVSRATVVNTTGVSSTTGSVEAEHGGDHAGEAENERQQGRRAGHGALRHPCTSGLEQAVPVAQVGQDEHAGQETDGGRQGADFSAGLVQAKCPDASRMPAAGIANTASGQSRGLRTANTSVPARSTTASVSAMGLGTVDR